MAANVAVSNCERRAERAPAVHQARLTFASRRGRMSVWTRSCVAALTALLMASNAHGLLVAADECSDAPAIDDVRFDEIVFSFAATTAPNDPLQSCTNGGPSQNAHSIWYRYVPAATGTLTIAAATAPFPGDPPTIVSVYTGSCASLQEVACAANPTRGDTKLVTRVLAENSYWIEVTNPIGVIGSGSESVEIALDPDSPICPSGGGMFLKGVVNLVGLGAPSGNQRLKITARVVFPEPLPQRNSDGLQLLVDSFVPEYATVAEWSARSIAIPSGGLGSGCDPRDGWTTSKNGASRRYRNHSNALPPACAVGSANGLKEVRLLRKSADWRVVDVKVRAKDMHLDNAPVFAGGKDALLWLSTTLGTTLGPETVSGCANTRPPLTCVQNGKGTAVTCTLK